MFGIICREAQELFDSLIREDQHREYLDKLKLLPEWMQEHSFFVGLVSMDLGCENMVPEKERHYLGLGGLLHDIGKIKIPIGILEKNSRLDPEEEDLMRKHVMYGVEELDGLDIEPVKYIVLNHHRFKRGNKYPECKINDEWDPLAQMVSVADKYDSMTSNRPYKAAMTSRTEIERELREAFAGDSKYVDQILLRHDLLCHLISD